MRLRFCARAVIGAACLAASISVAITGATAAPADYRFELVQAQPAGPGKTTVTEAKSASCMLVGDPAARPASKRLSAVMAETLPALPVDLPDLAAFDREGLDRLGKALCRPRSNKGWPESRSFPRILIVFRGR
jgi:hypothetical protein